jgi:hypothetical protein
VLRKCEFKALFRTNDSRRPCAILLIYTRSRDGFVDYICLPTIDANEQLWDKTQTALSIYLKDDSYTLNYGLSQFATYLTKTAFKK